MRSKRGLNLLFVFVLIFSALNGNTVLVQGRGGPDSGGYIYEDSNDPNGPAYNWEEISSSGTQVTLADDAISAAIPLPFSFHFYGQDYSSVYIGSNGFITFLNGQPHGKTPAAIPTGNGPNAIIAGFWGDLNPSLQGASIRYQTMGEAPNRRFIVQYNAVPHTFLLTIGRNPVTFQIKLFEGSNNIEVHYKTMASDGSTHVAGIENELGTTGLSYYNGTGVVENSMAVRYSEFTGIALTPGDETLYGKAGETLTFEQQVANWTGTATTFTLDATSPNWPTSISYPGKDITTEPLENGERATIIVQVEIPADAAPADYSEMQITLRGASYEAAATLVAAVPRIGYVMGYYNVSDQDAFAAIFPVDTHFHNSLHQPIDLENPTVGDAARVSAYANYGVISPDGEQLWLVDAGSGNQALAFDIIDGLPDASDGNYHVVPLSGESSDVAFTPDGKTAVITSFGTTAYEVDTDTYTVRNTYTTGTNSLKVVIGGCFPRKAYVANYGGTDITVIDLLNKTTKNISGFNKPHGIVVSPKTNRVYVANSGQNAGQGTIMVVNTLTDEVVATWNVKGDTMGSMVITPDGERLYVASNTNVLAIDANTGAVLATIPTPADTLWDAEIFPAGMGDYAYFTSRNMNLETVVVINTATNTFEKEIDEAFYATGVALFPQQTTCNVKPEASFTPSSAVARVGEPVSWTNTTIYGATKYTWDFGDGSEVSHDEHPTHTYTKAGNYTVTLTAENEHGTSTYEGKVHFAPVAGFEPVQSEINIGDTVTFKNTTEASQLVSYTWDFGDGTTSTVPEPQHTYTTVGDYTVTLTATNAYGTDTFTGKVDFVPRASFDPHETTIRPGEWVAFNNTSTGTNTPEHPLTFLWDFGDGTISTEVNPTHTFAGTEDVTVRLTASNGYGEESVATGTVKFRPRAQFSPTVIGIDVGETVKFTNQSTGPGPLSYEWDFGDGSPKSTEANPSHAYTALGNYTVTLKVTNANGSDTATGTVAFTPVASFTQSAEVIDVGGSVTFTNTSTGSEPISYHWDFGDGSTSTDKSPWHQYNTAGNYVVTLTATNAHGSSQHTGTVHFNPKAAFSPASATLQPGDSITFTNQSTGSTPMSYTWDFGDGTTSTEVNPIHTYTEPGVYTVKLTASNSYGPASTFTGTVTFKPKAAFSPVNSIIQVGDSITFENLSAGAGNITYEWDFGDGSAKSTEKNPTHRYTTAGEYTVTLTVTDTYGTHTATGTVLFKPKAAFTPLSSIIQVGDSIKFENLTTGTDTTTHPMTYTWDFGDGATSTAKAPTHQYTTAGSYTVKLTASNGVGEASVVTGTVVFKPKAAFNPSNSIIQVGDSIKFENLSTGTAPLTYTWDFGDGSPTSTEASPTHQYTKAGVYTVRLTVSNGIGEDGVATGTVNFRPKAIFSPTNSAIFVGDTITFTNDSTGTDNQANPLRYTWDFGDGSPTSSAKSPSHQYTKAGDYTVTLTVSNGIGADSVATGRVLFKPKAAFSPTSSVIQTGDTITFTNATTGTDTAANPLTYTWDFGDGTPTSTAKSPSHTYTTAGNYTVTLTARNGIGEESVATATVAFKPKAAFTPANSTIRLGEAITFTNRSTASDPLTYLWDFGDGTTSSEANPTHEYTAAGDYAVKLTVTSTRGSDTFTGRVVFQPTAAFSPASSASSPLILHVGDTVNFVNHSTGTDTAANPLSYQWDFGDGATSTMANPSHKYTTAGDYTVKLTVSNGFGQPSVATGRVVFAPTASFTPTINVIKLGDDIKLVNTSTGTGPLQYAWDFGDGSTGTAMAPSHVYTSCGEYTVRLTVSNEYGTSTATGMVVFAPKAAFTASAQQVMIGETVQFTNASTGTSTAEQPLRYTWDFGDGSPQSTLTNPTHTFKRPGRHTVTLTVVNEYGVETHQMLITVGANFVYLPVVIK